LIGDVYKLFIRNVSLCVLVTEGIHQEELGIIQNSISYAAKGLVVDLGTDQDTSTSQRCVQNDLLRQFSQFLVNTDDPLSYTFPHGRVGPSIIHHALSSSLSTTYPLSWYLFGFRLKKLMTENKINSLSLSNEGMKIAEELGMDRPNAVAALDHLMEHSMVLFFSGILNDTVFLGVEMFSCLFSMLSKTSHKHFRTISISDFECAASKCIKDSNFLSHNDLFTLLTELMIMAPYNKVILMPCLLPTLNEADRRMVCTQTVGDEEDPVYFECPSCSFEFILMLTVFLLNNKEWKIFQNEAGHPECLYKNCIKFVKSQKRNVLLQLVIPGTVLKFTLGLATASTRYLPQFYMA
jgi:hypothetical protein